MNMYPDLQSKSAQLYERGRKVMPGGNSRSSVLMAPYPVYARHAQGCRITDVDGVERIDFVNNWSSLIHGHCNERIVEAVARQSRRMFSIGMPTEVEIELAELLCERLPGVDQIRFSNSGSEGVLMALRAARAYTGRPKIAKCEGCYHGNADAVEVSVAPTPDTWGSATAPASAPATGGITASAAQETIVLPFNDVAATRAILEAHAGELAAVIMDPLVSRMGFVRATPDYLRMVREVTQQHGIVLIYDEVFSTRLGYHGAQGYVGITPDLTTLGKIIGGGLPIGATGGKAEIMAVFDATRGHPKVDHAGTFNANPMSMAAGLAAMQQMTPEAYARLEALGDRARNGLREAFRIAGLPGSVRGDGSFVSLAFTDRPVNNFRELAAAMGMEQVQKIFALHRHLLNNGVIIIPYGLLILSTAMTEAEIDHLVEQALAGMRAIARGAA
ncbi:MAG TPA: aspartate aminotransferase family protein [Steroidobacteraceae bacterium]